MSVFSPNSRRVSAIVPARNEEATISACVESLAQQKEIAEILVVNDQSTDRTAEIVRELMKEHPRIQLIETADLPAGWVGKNHAVWLGAQQAKAPWLLFTDADVLHEKDSAAKALEIAERQSINPRGTGELARLEQSRKTSDLGPKSHIQLISFSPEQITKTWYEKALIPVVYCRLAGKFSFDAVNDPLNTAAAANGQFLLINREAYQAVGGHAAIAGEVLEDVALAKRVKEAGYCIWFGSGKGIAWVRMYRTFPAMWEGWKKNLYRLMGGNHAALAAEIVNAMVPLLLLAFLVVLMWAGSGSWRVGVTTLAVAVTMWHWMYAIELVRNNYPIGLALCGIPGKILYTAVLYASFRSHQKGRLAWKGREYPVGTSGASKR
jgi:cellulose synthase/poly-beta-1,6-N-acetylglucosamine synthase-like glycosyltransferase